MAETLFGRQVKRVIAPTLLGHPSTDGSRCGRIVLATCSLSYRDVLFEQIELAESVLEQEWNNLPLRNASNRYQGIEVRGTAKEGCEVTRCKAPMASKPKPRQLSFPAWNARFDQLLREIDERASLKSVNLRQQALLANSKARYWIEEMPEKVQIRQYETPEHRRVKQFVAGRAIYGRADDALRQLLYMYVCGAPDATEFKNTFLRSHKFGCLQDQMEHLSGALADFNRGYEGRVFRSLFRETAPYLASAPRLRELNIKRIDHMYEALPELLAIGALLFRGQRKLLESFQVPSKKLIQSRALVVLYFHAPSFLFRSRKPALELANVISVAHEAAYGREKDYDRLAVSNRVNRFRLAHPDEFRYFRELVEKYGLPQDILKEVLFPSFQRRHPQS